MATTEPSDAGQAVGLPIVIASIMRPVGITGVQTHFRQFHTALKARGLQTEIITSFTGPAAIRYPLFAPRRVLERISGSAGVWWYYQWHRVLLAWALKQRLAHGEPAIIYAQSPSAARAALDVRRNRRQKVVLAIHFGGSNAVDWTRRGTIEVGGFADRGIRAEERSTIPRVDALVHVSADSRRDLLEQVPAAAALPNVIIPNFIERPPTPSKPPTRDVITLGTLETRKNQRYIVEVIAEARRLGRDITATLVGDGPDRPKLEALVDARGVRDLVQFAGYVDGGARLIPNHRIYVHSATYESFCIAAAEGLSYGRPVVAAPVGGLPEVFDDGVEGRYWPLDSPRRGAEILIELLDDSAEYERMAAAARRRFKADFDTDVVVPKLYGFLQEVGAGTVS